VSNVYGSQAVIAVDRVGGASGIVSVQATSITSGSAQQVTHFDRVQRSFSWQDGDQSPRLFRVPVVPESIPADTMLDLTVHLTAASKQSGIDGRAQQARIFLRSPRFTPQFTTRRISESTTIQGESNEITLVFNANSVLGPTATITVSGFVNSGESGTVMVALEGVDADVFGKVVEFDSTSGKALMHVAAGKLLLPDHEFSLQFKVRN